jgi:hypothetical protein
MSMKMYKFIDEFLKPENERMRGEVLRNHEDGLRKYVSSGAVGVLGPMRLPGILQELFDELDENEKQTIAGCYSGKGTADEAACMLEKLTGRDNGAIMRLVADLEAKRVETFEMCSGSGGPGPSPLTATMMYNADEIHVFGVVPGRLLAGVATDVTIRGNGYDIDDLPKIKFKHEDLAEQTPEYTPASIWCDPDLNEYLAVRGVVLSVPGYWRAYAKRPDETWSLDCATANRVYVP